MPNVTSPPRPLSFPRVNFYFGQFKWRRLLAHTFLKVTGFQLETCQQPHQQRL